MDLCYGQTKIAKEQGRDLLDPVSLRLADLSFWGGAGGGDDSADTSRILPFCFFGDWRVLAMMTI